MSAEKTPELQGNMPAVVHPLKGNKGVAGLALDRVIMLDNLLLISGWHSISIEVSLQLDNAALQPTKHLELDRSDVNRGIPGIQRVRGFIRLYTLPDSFITLQCLWAAKGLPELSGSRLLKPSEGMESAKAFLDENKHVLAKLFRVLNGSRAWLSLIYDFLGPNTNSMMKKAFASIEAAKANADGKGGIAVGWALAQPNIEFYLIDNAGAISKIDNAFRFFRNDIIEYYPHFAHQAPSAGFVRGMSAIDTELKLVALESNDLYSLHQRQWQASHLNMPKDPEFINWACHLPLNDHEFSEILHSAVGPILTHPGTWQFQILSKEPPRTSNFGAIKQNAKAILIVRLEKGCGYIQHQFLTLAKSSYFQNHVQIMFVTPSYPLFEQLQTMSARLWSIYHTPFAIYWQNLQTIKPVLEHINQRCNTDYYAFIDEDVFAADAKWLKLLVESLDKRPDYGALGVKLLDFQNDVQHTGLGLQRSSAGRSIRPKYLTNIDPTNDILEREATSGACFMTRKQLFLKVDGFDEFPLQHFEDADYCFKIRELGYKVGVHQKAELHSFFERLTRYDDKRHMELAAYKHMKVWHKKLASGSLSRDLH